MNNATDGKSVEAINCGENLKYLLTCVLSTESIPKSEYIKNVTIPGLNIGISTLNNARNGRFVSDNVFKMIASSFSFFYTGSENKGRITEEDLKLNPKEFKDKFPENSFQKKEPEKKQTELTLFTNKRYRGYYMLRNSSYKTYMAYFWFFEKKGKYSAAMLRGISDFNEIPDFGYKFKDVAEIKKCFKDLLPALEKKKSTSSIHLYLAEHNDIRYSPSCIQINFQTEEAVACYSTMYWNINIASISQQSSYIGGSALMVDTNEGTRGKDICAFKLGLECIDILGKKSPLNNTAPQVIAELMPKTKNGILLIDNADDANWYRFIGEGAFRSNSPGVVLDKNEIHQIINRLANLERDYRLRLDEADSLVNTLKEMTASPNAENSEGIVNKYKPK